MRLWIYREKHIWNKRSKIFSVIGSARFYNFFLSHYSSIFVTDWLLIRLMVFASMTFKHFSTNNECTKYFVRIVLTERNICAHVYDLYHFRINVIKSMRRTIQTLKPIYFHSNCSTLCWKRIKFNVAHRFNTKFRWVI